MLVPVWLAVPILLVAALVPAWLTWVVYRGMLRRGMERAVREGRDVH